MFGGLENEILKSAPVMLCLQSWNGFCETFVDMLNIHYELLAVGAPDWGII